MAAEKDASCKCDQHMQLAMDVAGVVQLGKVAVAAGASKSCQVRRQCVDKTLAKLNAKRQFGASDGF